MKTDYNVHVGYIHAVWQKLNLLKMSKTFKMISTEHSWQAIMAKFKLPEKPHGMAIFWIHLRRTYQDLSSQADPTRENWTWS